MTNETEKYRATTEPNPARY